MRVRLFFMQTNDKTMVIRVPEKTWKRLKAIAEKSDRSVASVARLSFEDYIKNLAEREKEAR